MWSPWSSSQTYKEITLDNVIAYKYLGFIIISNTGDLSIGVEGFATSAHKAHWVHLNWPG